MSREKPLAALAAVTAALALASPAATANAQIAPAQTAGSTIPTSGWLYATCPAWYGFKNPAIGCSSWADYFRYAALGGYGR
jgi:hypothetical protein